MDRPSRLSRTFVEEVDQPGRFGDGRGGNGLSLRVRLSRDGLGLGKTWEQRIYANGKVTTLGLGSYPELRLTAARELAAENAQRVKAAFPRASALDRLLAVEVDAPSLGPVVAANVTQRPMTAYSSAAPAFRDVSEEYIEARRLGWKGGSKTEGQTRSLLGTYILPVVGDSPVNLVTPAQVHDVLAPIWHTKAESSKKVRRLFKSIFAVAIAKGYREDDPTDRASLGLGRQRNITQHSAAVPYEQVGEVIQCVRESRSYESKRLALEFLILTAARTSEVRGMRQREVNYLTFTWTIPADRMKGGRPHRVPLSFSAVQVLNAAGFSENPDSLVFTDLNGGMLSQDGLRQLLKRRYPKATAHGFRSSFRDWAADKTDYAAEVAEHALAHLEGSTTVRSYLKTDMFEKRRGLMADWAEYVTGIGNHVMNPIP